MSQSLPVTMKEVVQLQNLGFDTSLIKPGVLSFESDSFICAHAIAGGQASVIKCDMKKNFAVTKQTLNKAEAVMMHPTKNIMAVRAKNDANALIIQVFNLEINKKVKDITLTMDVTFWKWLNDSTIALVTTSSVLLLSIDDQNSPARKIFDRQGTLANQNVFVMNLTCDINMQWFSLNAITTTKGPTGQPVPVGYIQLYNETAKQSQSIEGFCSCYGNICCVDETPSPLVAFIDKKLASPKHSLVITDISPAKRVKLLVDVQMTQDNDFPVIMNFVEDFGLLFLATNLGNLFIFEVSKGVLIFRCKISEDSLLFSAKNSMTGGIVYINKSGKVINVDIDKTNFIPFVMNYCKGVNNVMELCKSLAGRYHLPGAENIFLNLFKTYMESGNFVEAARICRDTPGDTLRNLETINMFKSLQGNPQPILLYFQTVMEKGKLNGVESVEMSRSLVTSNRVDLLNKWFTENKFTCTEELSELVKNVDSNLSLKILMASGSSSAHGKIIEAFVNAGQVDKIMPYCMQNNYNPDWITLMKNIVAVNPKAGAGLAKMICNRQTGKILVDVNQIMEIFVSRKRIQELTEFMVEYLKSNLAEDAYLQTKILELNLFENPKAALMILESNFFNHYDRQKIATICEKMSLYQVCLDNYTDINDIKRIVVRTNVINPEALVNYFGKLTPENCLICLHELMHSNPLQNLNIVIEAAVRYVQRIPLNELVKLFETYGNYNGLYAFLNKISTTINDPEIMYKYICAGVITNNVNEISEVIKNFDNYDPKKILDFFLEKKLVNPRPLIILCDKHDYIEQLTVYLYKNKLTKFLENYVFTYKPQSTPRIIGTLIDEECDENYIKQILNTVRGSCPIEALVEEVLKRHKVKMIQKFLEDRADEGNPTPALYNALAMIYVETNNNAKDFLMNNKYFDPKVVGNYCEDRDPQLALLAYKKASGSCDDELIALTNKNAMYRAQAQYLVESLNADLWKKVLTTENEHKKSVTDQVIQVILPNTRNPEEVSITVKAFIEAGLQADLMDLLEKLVLHNNEFSKNKSLQNLLILTAITTEGKKVKGFLTRLEAYDGADIAIKCLENNLSEEAFYIYDQKTKEFSQAIDVLIRYIDDLKRATIYAEKINLPEVWGKLGRALLTHDIIDEAIEAFIKATDAEMYNEVINSAERQGKFDDLIRYLNMARTLKKDKFIDCELVYSLSRCNKLVELETLLGQSSISDLGTIGDRLFDEAFYEPAKIIYEHLGNNARLASCYVYLKNYSQAIVAAKKSNTQKCWKEICFACIRAGEYRLAAQAGNSIIQVADIVEEVIKEYEKYGAYTELIALFESNLVGERNHIITELGVLYAKYLPNKLMDHCRNYFGNMNVPKVIRVCEQCYLWEEVVFLYSHYNGYDNALLTMIEHSPLCWKHELYTQTLSKVTNSNLYSESIRFYMAEQPQHLNDMLKVIAQKIDLSTAVFELRKVGALTLAVPFLKSVQVSNNFDINEALNEIYVEEEDPESLKTSILEYSSFDQLTLAKKIESHPLLEFRRISALVYRKNKKFVESIEISKKLEFFKDAIDTALESGKEELTEELLRFFAAVGDKECFAACLYTCYEFVKPDIAMELSWRYNLNEFSMPYMIQTTRDMTKQMDHMQMKADISEEKAKKEKAEIGDTTLDMNSFIPPTQLIMYGQQPGGMGMGMGTGMGGQGMGMGGQGMGMGGMGMGGMNMGGY